MKLRQAASTIFALTALLPLLLFLLFIWRSNRLEDTEAQLGLFLALTISLLGFVTFRQMVDRISRMTRMLGEGAPEAPLARGARADIVPGLGEVSEIGELAQAFNRMLQELRGSTERLEDLVFKLGSLNELVEMSARIPKVQDLLDHILERTMRAVRASIGSIMLLDHERQTLTLAVGRGLPEDVSPEVRVKVGEGIAGKVFQVGEPVLVEDIEKDPRFAKINDPKYGSGSFICMPLRVGDRAIGVLNLAKKEHSAGDGSSIPPFSHTDLQFLNTLMTYTAYAVDNARLLEETQQAAERLNAVVEDQKLRLTIAQKQMIQAAKLSALGELVAGVAHELNNPLTVLVGYTDLLSRDAPPSMRTELQTMKDSGERARRIVKDLLTFARQMPLQRSHVDLARLLERVLNVTAPDLRLEQVAVECEVDPDLPRVWADDNQLQQVLINMITNAKQAMAEVDGERRVRIALHHAGPERVRIVVEDTGPGIPDEIVSKIFDPFVTTKGAQGTGLGLSISYGIIREHGGQISAENAQGRGARFTIELPVGRLDQAQDTSLPLELLQQEAR